MKMPRGPNKAQSTMGMDPTIQKRNRKAITEQNCVNSANGDKSKPRFALMTLPFATGTYAIVTDSLTFNVTIVKFWQILMKLKSFFVVASSLVSENTTTPIPVFPPCIRLFRQLSYWNIGIIVDDHPNECMPERCSEGLYLKKVWKSGNGTPEIAEPIQKRAPGKSQLMDAAAKCCQGENSVIAILCMLLMHDIAEPLEHSYIGDQWIITECNALYRNPACECPGNAESIEPFRHISHEANQPAQNFSTYAVSICFWQANQRCPNRKCMEIVFLRLDAHNQGLHIIHHRDDTRQIPLVHTGNHTW